MRRLAYWSLCSLSLLATPSAATTPQDVLSELSATDPLYDTESCLQARNVAMQYDNKGILRGTLDLATFLTGPVATAAYSAVDHGHLKSRDAVVNEIRRRCISNYGSEQYSAKKDAKQCVEKNGKIICEAKP